MRAFRRLNSKFRFRLPFDLGSLKGPLAIKTYLLIIKVSAYPVIHLYEQSTPKS